MMYVYLVFQEELQKSEKCITLILGTQDAWLKIVMSNDTKVLYGSI